MSIHAYNLFSSNPPPFPLLQLLPHPPPHFLPSSCALSLIPLSPFSVPVCAHAWDHFLSGTTSVMKTDSPLQCPSVRGGTSWGPPPSMLGFWLTWIHICSPSQCEFTCATTMSCLANTVFWGRLFLWLLHSFCSLFHDDFWALEGRGVAQMFSLGPSTLKSLILWMLTSYGSLY